MSDQVTGLLSPFLRRQRLAAAQPYLTFGQVLDVGCGTGSLASMIEPERYLGIDSDAQSTREAGRLHPGHRFATLTEFQQEHQANRFDVIVALAVVEHISDPIAWLSDLKRLLQPGGRIVLTTPSPYFGWAHALGARLGIFSREAANEHETLIDVARMRETAARSGFQLAGRRLFLLGANQLFVLRRDDERDGNPERARNEDVRKPAERKSEPTGQATAAVEKPSLESQVVRTPRLLRRAGTLICLAAGAAVLWPLVTHGRNVWATAQGGPLVTAVGAGAAVYACLSGLLALAWWWLLGVYGSRPSLASGLSVWARTQIAKYLPGNVFHYLGRHALGRCAGATHSALASAALLELVSLLLAAMILQASVAATRHTETFLSVPVAAGLALGGILGWPLLDRLIRRTPIVAGHMSPLPTLSVSRSAALLGPAILLHATFLLGTGLILFGIIWAAWPGQSGPWSEIVWMYALAWTASTITPGAPGGAGVREALLTVMLAGHLGTANAAAAAVALRAVTVTGDVLTAGWGYLLPLKCVSTPDQAEKKSCRTANELLPYERS